jgi:hypothetical protein
MAKGTRGPGCEGGVPLGEPSVGVVQVTAGGTQVTVSGIELTAGEIEIEIRAGGHDLLVEFDIPGVALD